MDGILWILQTGARWKDLSERYPSYQTCHRYFQIWMRKRILYKVLASLARDLEERGGYDLSECFVDAMFVSAKKGRCGCWPD
jgi:transposase